MTGIILIVILVLLGFFLMFIEVFVPGGVVGLMGVISLVAGVALAYMELGTNWGHVTLLAIMVFGAVGAALWFRYLPTSRFGRRLIFEGKSPKPPPDRMDLIDQTGNASTPLRPAGIANIHGRRIDVITEGQFAEIGQSVRVIRVEGARVVVRVEAAAGDGRRKN